MVASSFRGLGPSKRLLVSIPFIAGQWSLPVPPLPDILILLVVSIPFIAGQWSLRAAAALHAHSDRCFNPLHCGAVVASICDEERFTRALPVSIPFIAGQWSLLRHADLGEQLRIEVSIPFIAGQWSLHNAMEVVIAMAALVSIPFIAGQWSLP